MRSLRKSLFVILAISVFFSTMSLCIFALDTNNEVVETPMFQLTSFKYRYNHSERTATLVSVSGSVSSVNVPSSASYNQTEYKVVAIDPDAFAKCSSAKSIEIPDSVTAIGKDAFAGTAWLSAQEDGVVYAGKVAYTVKGTSPESIVLKEGTLGVAEGAFSACSELRHLVVPESVVTMPASALEGCDSLTVYGASGSAAQVACEAAGVNFVACPALVLAATPQKSTYYVGDSLNLSGAELLYITTTGIETVTLTEQMVTGFDSAEIGGKTLKITYEGLIVSFDITVKERPAVLPGDVNGDVSVTSDDAIYLLYHTLYSDDYPVNQEVDFNKDGGVTSDDAIYLLYHTLYPNDYPIS